MTAIIFAVFVLLSCQYALGTTYQALFGCGRGCELDLGGSRAEEPFVDSV